MKKNLRFYLALFFAKGTALVLKLIGRKGTSMPGSWAIILCPDFIGRIDKPKKIIGITGTNGKTTVTNLVVDLLEKRGESFICNREGSNVPTGIASALIANSTLFGKQKKQMAVFEIDERSSLRIFPYMEPDFLLVTNLFRDSCHRNAHTEYIFDILDRNIPKKTKLILNGDDPLCSRMRQGGKHLFFGMLPQEFESGKAENLVCDDAVCPKCSNALSYDFHRYHHIGIAHCDNCGYQFPQRDYLIELADLKTNKLTALVKGQNWEMPLLADTPINMYNQIAALALLTEAGYPIANTAKDFEGLGIAQSRFTQTQFGEKTIIRFLAKGQNPVACSRAFDIARSAKGKKCILLFLDDIFQGKSSVEDICFQYDTDYEFLNDPDIRQIIVGGDRHCDTNMRLLMAGISPQIISHAASYEEALGFIDYEKSDIFMLLFDNFLAPYSMQAQELMAKKAISAKKAPDTLPTPEPSPQLPVSKEQENIVVEILFPELCKLFGDLGNVRYLKKCLPGARFVETGINDTPLFLTEKVNFVYMGPMTEGAQEKVIARLMPYKEKIAACINGGLPCLFTGNALEVLGKYIETDDGRKIPGLGLLDLWARRNLFQRHNSAFQGEFEGKALLGFKTQFTMCYPANEEHGLFPVNKGMGMNPESSFEGIRLNNFFGTYLVGPLLVMNPSFTLYLLKLMGESEPQLAFAAQAEEAYDARCRDFDSKVSKDIGKYKFM